MAALTCPYCGHAIVSDDPEAPAERCPSCSRELQIAYRYRLIRTRGELAGGVLYEALDAGFDQHAAVLFVADPSDEPACARFLEGHRLFANLRTRGLVGIHEVSRPGHPRPHVVMDWLAGGTLDRFVGKSGPLDPALAWAMTSDLLIGLERAHRALPALVHGQIHPGKIGFRKPVAEGGSAVLFGFEWARQVSEQDSMLADSFNAAAPERSERASALDLRALARTIVYAATGRWIEDGTVERQRQQAANLIPGPLAPFIDRLFAAGTPEGYRSTSVARDEFETLRGGGESRRLREPARSAIVDAPFTAAQDLSLGELFDRQHDHAEHDDDDDDDLEELEELEELEPEPPPARAPTPRAANVASAPSPALLEQLRQRQAQLASTQPTAQPASKNGGKFVMFAIFGLIGTCTFASIVADIDDDPNMGQPPPRSAPEPVPDWTATPAPSPEPTPIPEPIPELAPEPAPPAFASRKWTAKVAGAAKGPVKYGSRCELWVGAPDDSSYNCRWALDCKQQGSWVRYYGGGGAGFGHCEIAEDRVVYVSDLQDDDGDGLFVFDARGERAWALFGDRFASPGRALLFRFEPEGELAERPSHAKVTDLERRVAEDVPTDEFRESGLAIEKLANEVELELDLVPDEAPLPATLDIFALQATIDAIQPDLLACSAPEGTRVDVKLTVVGGTGRARTMQCVNAVDADHQACLVAVLTDVEFDRFSDESMNVEWTITW
ncbi:hypothetical protein ACNOYE_00500 [Nannocystaceae bacterium ST9]